MDIKKTVLLGMMILLRILGVANNDGKIKINILMKEQAHAAELHRVASPCGSSTP